ncbi:lateral flagellin LafA [Pseudomonas sp. PDM18]|uniref:lateral flagellin LafA n=1 Tax=unclassified Pseudomonas TaxID=196821 RepID=UPI0017817D7E|nr:lateral flagellin LafA [Pseudomonas sp. PDM18]MBD9677610.1 lateral flagellin LafA [Pseudomonas sp. PDM18]MDF3864999.1 lateral flagellin LafA [Pseudomonas denitrificans (nom. rej.)]
MALSIQTNYSSLITQTNLGKTNSLLATNQQRLGTGLRINSAADDAAGLQIATRLNAQSRGMDVAMRNTSDAISLMQTADGAFSELTDITQRMKDLATQAANGTNSTDDGKALSAEFNELGKELTNIISNTKFAGDALFGVDGASGKFGTTGGVTFQIGSDKAETLNVDVATQLKAVTDAFGTLTKQFAATPAAGTELETITDANTAIDNASSALDAIGSLRAQFGANINRLQHTSNNLANMKDNTDLSKGRIMDADFAVESANMSKNSMLMQSGISMLKQAGQMPSMIMGLLG